MLISQAILEYPMGRHCRPAGFTLIELLVTLTIAGVVVGLAVPSFTAIVRSARADTHISSLVTSLNYARSEAIIRRADVVVSPTAGGTDWQDGWRIWADADGDGAFDAGEELQVLPALTGEATLTSGEGQASVSFNRQGRAATIVNFDYRLGEGLCHLERDASVSLQGRVNVQRRNCP